MLKSISSLIKDVSGDRINAHNKVRIITSKSHDPFFNIALEEWLFNEGDVTYPILYLWRNAPNVIIGKHQNPWKECNIQQLEKNNLVLVRRRSGGGAVYQDLGNSIFTFLCNKEDHSVERNFEVLKRAVGRFGITAEPTGRNDMTVEGRKVSGSAFRNGVDRAIHHGTMMLNVNMDELSLYLNVNKEKLLSKGLSSVHQRVANLCEFCPYITHEQLCDSIRTEFARSYQAVEELTEEYDVDVLKTNSSINALYDELHNWEWRFGKTPDFEHNLETRFEWGVVDLYLNVTFGKISSAKFYSDTLYPAIVEAVELSLIGAPYDVPGISAALSLAKEKLVGMPPEQHIEDIRSWMIERI